MAKLQCWRNSHLDFPISEGGQPSLQVGPLNMAIRQEGDVDVEPDVEGKRGAI